MTSVGETTNMTLGDHIKELEQYSGTKIDVVILNKSGISRSILKKYRASHQLPVKNILNPNQIKRIKVISSALLSQDIYNKTDSDILERSMLKHDSKKLSKILQKII